MLKKLVATACLLCPSIGQTGEQPQLDDFIVSPESVDYRSYTTAWTQWLYSIPNKLSPLNDKNGAHCAFNQAGETWFLTSFESPEPVSRTCNVPAGKRLFMPLMRNLIFTPPDIDQTCEEAQGLSLFESNPNYRIEVNLNGSSLLLGNEFITAPSDCFDLFAKVPASANAPKYAPSSTAGYWVMFEALQSGTHELSLKATYIDHENNAERAMLNVTYQISVQ